MRALSFTRNTKYSALGHVKEVAEEGRVFEGEKNTWRSLVGKSEGRIRAARSTRGQEDN